MVSVLTEICNLGLVIQTLAPTLILFSIKADDDGPNGRKWFEEDYTSTEYNADQQIPLGLTEDGNKLLVRDTKDIYALSEKVMKMPLPGEESDG